MKRYHLKKTFLLRLQGVILLLLGYASHNLNADDAALFFALFGCIMVFSNIEFISRGIYKLSKNIYRRGRWREF